MFGSRRRADIAGNIIEKRAKLVKNTVTLREISTCLHRYPSA